MIPSERLAKCLGALLNLRKSVFISACLHVAVFLALLLFSDTGRAKLIPRPNYQVRLVRPDEVPGLVKPKKPAEKPKPAAARPKQPDPPKKVEKPPEPEKKAEPEKAKAKPKPEPKPVAKAAPDAPNPEPKETVSLPEAKEPEPPKPVEPPEPAPEEVLSDVLAKIKKKVGSEPTVSARRSPGPGQSWAERKKIRQEAEYGRQVKDLVAHYWYPPPSLKQEDEDLVTVVQITLGPDGQVLDYSIKASSGSVPYDQSVLRAILKSRKFPPPPMGLKKTYHELELNFHPEDRS